MRIGLIGVGRIGAFHAATLRGLPGVGSVVISDADPGRARDVAGRLGTGIADSVHDLLAAGVDALVIATATGTHPELIRLGVENGLPVFCEKPVAPDIDGTLDVIKQVNGGGAAVQIGFQRRFDAGFRAARDAVQQGALGWLHTIRSTTLDPAPPPAGYIPGSGGIFRDCAVHDFDAIRWVSGREVVSAYAVGANRGADFFRTAGDVDTAAAVLTMDDGTIALVSCTRYNAAGYDVRLEVLGEKDSVCAGLDDRMPLRSADPGTTFPRGPAHRQFMERFHDAYVAELTAFLDVVTNHAPSPCTPRDALEAFYVAEACELSRHRGEPVTIAEVRR
jgi:myo-inositol 2-dehydrogenase / D-chiro-inositol 1-dehydrogenase